jgi:CRISPR-associated endonuclease/helicase Cas3
MSYIAHYREYDGVSQSVQDHLENVARLSAKNGAKLGLGKISELIGLLHDLGKYSDDFQNYIKSGIGMYTKNDPEWVDADKLKGQIDHSTAGAVFANNKAIPYVSEIISLVVASHHSGIINMLSEDGIDSFGERITKVISDISPDDNLINELEILFNDPDINNLTNLLKDISKEYNRQSIYCNMSFGFVVRFLESVLIDADRTDTAEFESPIIKSFKSTHPNWSDLIKAFNDSAPKGTGSLNKARQEISDACFESASNDTGLFKLTVPTGGGKTLSSLRFALNHANKHNLDRIIYVMPYTSIIDQNAEVFKNIFNDLGNDIVLEHHSNVIQNDDNPTENWKHKTLSESWNAPIVVTTSVQFLNALFDGSTRNIRRMHSLTNSLIIFDEIQTLPINMVHIFNHAVNFLTDFGNSSVVLCTATQPLLHKVDSKLGNIPNGIELVPNYAKYFDTLKRVDVVDSRKKEPWSPAEVAEHIKLLAKTKSVLYIANTKNMVKETYHSCISRNIDNVYHLSTSMCPKHRKIKLKEIIDKLKNNVNVVCISTQLIEAGVDVDFDHVIRSIAGLPSICQSAGRCNRNNYGSSLGIVEIINPDENETTKWLKDIKIGKDKVSRVLREVSNTNDDIIGLKALDKFYKYYFFDRKSEMSYAIDGKPYSVLDVLSNNSAMKNEYERVNKTKYTRLLKQSFKIAGEEFKVIDSPARGIIVLYDNEVKDIIHELGKDDLDISIKIGYIKKLQQYQVNVFQKELDMLDKNDAIHTISDDEIMYVDEEYYNDEFGLAPDDPSPLTINIV